MSKYGYVLCAHCGIDVAATATGKAARHGFIRVKRGGYRVYMPHLASGHDHHPCAGSGQPGRNWWKPDLTPTQTIPNS